MIKKLVVLFFVLLSATFLFAENYTFRSYDVDVVVHSDRVYEIREHIELNFNQRSHGIIRDIPVGSGRDRYILKLISSSDPYERSYENGYVSFRLGSADEYILGPKSYDLVYSLDVGADEYDDYDEVYLNLLGPEWGVPIENFTFSVSFPSSVDSDYVFITSGRYGSTENDRVSYKISNDRRIVAGYAPYLESEEAVTLRAEFPEGTFEDAREIPDFTIPALICTISVTIALVLFAYSLFLKYGRDEEPIVSVRFDPPEGLNPCEVGFLKDNAIDDEDLTAMVFYWADKGLIRIEEDDEEFTLVKLKDISSDANEGERSFFNALMFKERVLSRDLERSLFGDHLQSTIIPRIKKRFELGECQLKDQAARSATGLITKLTLLYAIFTGVMLTLNGIEMALFGVVISFFHFVLLSTFFKRFFDAKDLKRKGLLFRLIFIIILCTLVFVLDCSIALLGYSYDFSAVIAIFLVFGMFFLCLFGAITEKRTAYAQKKLEEILGYREFLEKVEIDRLKALIDSDPEFFYHNLSYAITLGLEKKWAKKFSFATIRTPDWYSGRSVAEDALFYTVLNQRFRNAYITTATRTTVERTPGGRASRTFHGGSGFSGGGAGGGGGRSW
ncbi:MAG: DUF2207 domain-containing protein [Spirochaetales bacterium]|nr:DUF2207 domain-containing protein [Spirochaetales bacterium]